MLFREKSGNPAFDRAAVLLYIGGGAFVNPAKKQKPSLRKKTIVEI
jgi:hypothetical protein